MKFGAKLVLVNVRFAVIDEVLALRLRLVQLEAFPRDTRVVPHGLQTCPFQSSRDARIQRHLVHVTSLGGHIFAGARRRKEEIVSCSHCFKSSNAS